MSAFRFLEHPCAVQAFRPRGAAPTIAAAAAHADTFVVVQEEDLSVAADKWGHLAKLIIEMLAYLHAKQPAVSPKHKRRQNRELQLGFLSGDVGTIGYRRFNGPISPMPLGFSSSYTLCRFRNSQVDEACPVGAILCDKDYGSLSHA